MAIPGQVRPALCRSLLQRVILQDELAWVMLLLRSYMLTPLMSSVALVAHQELC